MVKEDIDKISDLVAGHAATAAEKEADAEKQKAVEDYLKANTAKVQQWLDTHPGERLPVYWIEGKVVWLNKWQRKLLRKQGSSSRQKEPHRTQSRLQQQGLIPKKRS